MDSTSHVNSQFRENAPTYHLDITIRLKYPERLDDDVPSHLADCCHNRLTSFEQPNENGPLPETYSQNVSDEQATEVEPVAYTSSTDPSSHPAMLDYEMQLLLLEMLNEKRIALARAEQRDTTQQYCSNHDNGFRALRDYEAQLHMLAMQNRNRLELVRLEEANCANGAYPEQDYEMQQSPLEMQLKQQKTGTQAEKSQLFQQSDTTETDEIDASPAYQACLNVFALQPKA